MANSSQGKGTLFAGITLNKRTPLIKGVRTNKYSRQCVGRFLLPLVQECYG